MRWRPRSAKMPRLSAIPRCPPTGSTICTGIGTLIDYRGTTSRPWTQARRWFQAEPPLRPRLSREPVTAGSAAGWRRHRNAPGAGHPWHDRSVGHQQRRFAVFPCRSATGGSLPQGGIRVDVQAISRAIGIDISQWPETAAPVHACLRASTGRRRGRDTHPILHTDMTVQAAAWHGKITDLQVLWPWSKPWHEPESLQQFVARFWLATADCESLPGWCFCFPHLWRRAICGRAAATGAAHGGWRWHSSSSGRLCGPVLDALGGRCLDDRRSCAPMPRRLARFVGAYLAALYRAGASGASALAAFHPDVEPRAGGPLAGCPGSCARALWRAGGL